jgi:hypothetical protein
MPILPSRRLVLWLGALAVSGSIGFGNAIAGQSTISKDVSCGCPQISAVGTADKPATGQVPSELTFADLESYFSDREALYGGDWDKAMQALANAIDPTGAMQIATGPAPSPSGSPGKFAEGGLSYVLINGSPPAPNTELWHRLKGDTVSHVMVRIITTLARINKYGEPTFGLRKALLRVARFLTRDLTRMPDEVWRSGGGPNSKPQRLFSTGAEAIRALHHAIYVAALFAEGNPGLESGLAQRTNMALAKKQLPPPDYFDEANAALDILLSVDEKGHRDGIIAYNSHYSVQTAHVLIAAASLRPVFGGVAAAKSPADAIGCKAFAILVALAAIDAKDGAKFRTVLRDTLANPRSAREEFQPPAPQLKRAFAAARGALIVAGLTDDDRPNEMGRAWVDAAYDNRDQRPDKLTTIRDIEGFAKGPGRSAFTAGAQVALDEIRREGPSEKVQEFLAQWSASKPDWDPLIAQPLCAAPETTGRPILIAKGVFHDFVIDKIYPGVPTVVAVVFDEPFSGDSYPVIIKIGGASLALTATPADDEHRVFATETFVPQP